MDEEGSVDHFFDRLAFGNAQFEGHPVDLVVDVGMRNTDSKSLAIIAETCSRARCPLIRRELNGNIVISAADEESAIFETDPGVTLGMAAVDFLNMI